MAKTKASVKKPAQKKSPPTESNGHTDSYDITSLGGQLKVTSQTTVELSHDLAHELLAMPAFTAERPLRKSHVGKLARHMEHGTFHWNLVTLVVCRCKEGHDGHPPGTFFRMNGQHTCHARLQLPASTRTAVKMVKYSAETEADLRRLYSTIDRGAPRSRANVISSYISGTEQFANCPGHIRSTLAPGMALWKWEANHERQSHDAEDIAFLLLHKERSVVEQIVSFFSPMTTEDTKHLRRAPVIAAMMETFSKQPESSREFWLGVATGLNMKSANDPRKRLHKLLLTNAVIGGSNSISSKRSIGKGGFIAQESMYRVCISCFNAWKEGRDIQMLRVSAERMEAV